MPASKMEGTQEDVLSHVTNKNRRRQVRARTETRNEIENWS